MAITLNGTTGVTTTGLTSTGIDDNATSTAITIDASQNVGIGTTSPNSNGGASATVCHVNNSGAGTWAISHYTNGTTGSLAADGLIVGNIGADAYIFNYEASNLIFGTNAAESMRIDSSGSLLVATTSNTGSSRIHVSYAPGGTGFGSAWTSSSSAGFPAVFYTTSGQAGYIYTSGTSTSYATSSDYRLKENIVALDNGIDRLKQIPVHRFNFIADPDTTVDGFLAHEVQDVVPEAITGTKDAVDAEGNPEYQGIDQSKLVPLLTAALQEAVAKIEDLESRLSALETN